MAKVVIYLRVSTAEQTVKNQLPALEKWISDRGYELVEVYQENESAWKSEVWQINGDQVIANHSCFGRVC